MGLSPTFGAQRFPKGERKALWCARRRKPFFRPGLTRRLRRGWWGCRLMGFHQLRCPKVSKGRAESPLVSPQAQTSCRRRGGLTRRLRRGRWGCRPEGAVLSFEAKESTKESQRHGTTGKRLLLPILTAGLAMSRAMELDSFHQLLERARARLFPPSKWAGLFPSAAYRRPRPCGRRGAYATLAGWDALMWHSRFSRATGKRVLETMLACGASRKTFRRAAVCTGQSAEDHIRPASREACRRAAVKPRTTCMSLYAPARHRRAVRGKGRREEARAQWAQPP